MTFFRVFSDHFNTFSNYNKIYTKFLHIYKTYKEDFHQNTTFLRLRPVK